MSELRIDYRCTIVITEPAPPLDPIEAQRLSDTMARAIERITTEMICGGHPPAPPAGTMTLDKALGDARPARGSFGVINLETVVS